MRVEVTDPRKVISHIRVLVETPQVVVLYINLNKKHAVVERQAAIVEAHSTDEHQNPELWMTGDAKVTVVDLPITGSWVCAAETARYECYVTFVNVDKLGDLPDVYVDGD